MSFQEPKANGSYSYRGFLIVPCFELRGRMYKNRWGWWTTDPDDPQAHLKPSEYIRMPLGWSRTLRNAEKWIDTYYQRLEEKLAATPMPSHNF